MPYSPNQNEIARTPLDSSNIFTIGLNGSEYVDGEWRPKFSKDSINELGIFRTSEYSATTDTYPVVGDYKRLSDFNRYSHVYPDEEQSNLLRYVFLVRPDLNIVDQYKENSLCKYTEGDPTFNYLMNDAPGILAQLCNSKFPRIAGYTDHHDFLSFLVGRTTNYSTNDYTLATYEDTQLFTGYKFVYPGNANVSQSGISFDLTFRDDKNMNISKLFYAWCYYIDGELKGVFPPLAKYRGTKIADYMSSLYYFVCGPDGSEILYYQKVTGCFPTAVPFSFYSMNSGAGAIDKPEISIPFVGAVTEHLNPTILAEFNFNSGLFDTKNSEYVLGDAGTKSWIQRNYLPSYQKASMVGKFLAGKPFVCFNNVNGKYYLLWTKRQS